MAGIGIAGFEALVILLPCFMVSIKGITITSAI
jgi:hypothetical protein